MTQVELRDGNRTMVGFVESRFARLGLSLRIGDAWWTVSAVYATDSAAWWFKVSEKR